MIFTEDENSFSLETTPFTPDDEFKKGLWLLLVGIHETPPHIALIADGKYYSVSTKKVDNGSSAESFVSAIKRKQIQVLFIEIETLSQSPFRGLGQTGNKLLVEIYSNLQPLGNTNETCLSPIKSFFTPYFSTEFKEVNYVFELLAIAQKRNLLKQCLLLSNETPNSNSITLPKYNLAQIRKRINQLSAPITSSN